MAGLITFMNSVLGRALRVLLGLLLIAYGLFALGGTGGAVVVAVGLVPLALGLWGHCSLEIVAGRPRPVAR